MSAYLRAIRLVNFRNYADATALLAPGLNVVVGDNAQGKTNLLEAIAFNVAGVAVSLNQPVPNTPSDRQRCHCASSGCQEMPFANLS